MNNALIRNRQMLAKVPEVTIYFWIIKLLTTAMGESTSDYLVQRLNPYLAVAIGFTVFVFALTIQLKARRYIAWIYWLTVTMVAIFGTMAADVLHVGLGIPYIASALFFAIGLAIVFIIWQKVEGTLSIHSVITTRRELFYWLTVVTTFALGTACGDLAAYTFKLGFFNAGIVFLVLMAVPLVGWWRFKLNLILAFWFAYILTRPLGASIADWTGKATNAGGLGIGDPIVSSILTILIICFVAYYAHKGTDVQAE